MQIVHISSTLESIRKTWESTYFVFTEDTIFLCFEGPMPNDIVIFKRSIEVMAYLQKLKSYTFTITGSGLEETVPSIVASSRVRSIALSVTSFIELALL